MILTAGVCLIGCAHSTKQNGLEGFIESHVEKVKPLAKQQSLAWWDAATTGESEAYERASKTTLKIRQIYSNPQEFALLRDFKESGQVKEALSARQLDVLYRSYLGNQIEPEMLKDWFNYFRPRVGGYNPLPYGAFIMDPNGERIGLWYSVVDWRLTGSATFGENNEVTIFMPTNQGHRKRDQDPFQNEYDVSNEKYDDNRYFRLSSYSKPADRLRRYR